jgi:hypothetical protein
MTRRQDLGLRESVFRVFAGSSMLVINLQTNTMLKVLKGSLEDSESIDVSGLEFFFSFIPDRSIDLAAPGPTLNLTHLSLLPILIQHPPTRPIPIPLLPNA